MEAAFGDPAYGLTRHLAAVPFADAVERAREALAAQGFGVMTEIDVKAKLHDKLGVERRPYLILGACNPPLAHSALSVEPGIGLLLPCNVVVAEEDGGCVVSAIDPVAMFAVLGRPEMEGVAVEVRAKLDAVLDIVARRRAGGGDSAG